MTIGTAVNRLEQVSAARIELAKLRAVLMSMEGETEHAERADHLRDLAEEAEQLFERLSLVKQWLISRKQ